MEIKTNKPLEQFSVKGVNVSISPNVDGNIKPENIKKDVSILGIVGTLEGGGGELPPYIDPENFTFDGSVCTGYKGDQTLPEIIIPKQSTDGILITSVEWVDYQSGFEDYTGSIIMLNNITSIGLGAFASCGMLTSIIIPNSVKLIGMGAFTSCGMLTSITIPNSVQSIGGGAFLACRSLNNITFTGTISQWNAITKDYDWNSGVPAQVVHCNDGDAPIN